MMRWKGCCVKAEFVARLDAAREEMSQTEKFQAEFCQQNKEEILKLRQQY